VGSVARLEDMTSADWHWMLGVNLWGVIHGTNVFLRLLKENAENYTWTAAAIGSQNAAGYQLATDRPVMAVGGFNRSDPAPTLERFRQYVEAGKIHYFLGGNVSVGAGGSSDSARIASWVEENYPAVTVDQVTVYDLTNPVPHS